MFQARENSCIEWFSVHRYERVFGRNNIGNRRSASKFNVGSSYSGFRDDNNSDSCIDYGNVGAPFSASISQYSYRREGRSCRTEFGSQDRVQYTKIRKRWQQVIFLAAFFFSFQLETFVPFIICSESHNYGLEIKSAKKCLKFWNGRVYKLGRIRKLMQLLPPGNCSTELRCKTEFIDVKWRSWNSSWPDWRNN